MSEKPRAVALLSGGLDSATTLAVAIGEGFEAHTITFDYGQRHRIEIERAQRLSKALGAADHKLVRVDLSAFGGSALTDDIAVPKTDPGAPVEESVPVTYVPARNTVFLSLALAYAETLGAGDIFFGANAIDFSGYPDCRPEYIQAFETMANLATKEAVEGRMNIAIHAPLIAMTKREIIQTGAKLGVDFSLTLSCYDPGDDGRPCGQCDSCRLRAKGFEEAGMDDPAL